MNPDYLQAVKDYRKATLNLLNTATWMHKRAHLNHLDLEDAKSCYRLFRESINDIELQLMKLILLASLPDETLETSITKHSPDETNID